MLLSMVTFRAQFIESIPSTEYKMTNYPLPYSPKIESLYQPKEDLQLARHVNGFGYSRIIMNKKVVGLLPVYPSGASQVQNAKQL